MAKRRTFTAAFKARVAKEALRGDKTVRDEREAEIRKLHEKIGQLVIERDFLPIEEDFLPVSAVDGRRSVAAGRGTALAGKESVGGNRWLGRPLWRMHGFLRVRAAERGSWGAVRTGRTRCGCGAGAAGLAVEGADGLRERAREGAGGRRDALAAARRKSGADGAQHVHEESSGDGGAPGSKRSTTSMVPAWRVGQGQRASAGSASFSDCASGAEGGGMRSRRRHRSRFRLRRGPASSPKWRMRWKRGGRTCSRNLRMLFREWNSIRLFRQPACVQGRFGTADERLAADWQPAGVALETVRRAILLGSVRKSMSLLDRPGGEPVRSLRYFAGLLEEVRTESFPPSYWRHVEFSLRRCERLWRNRPVEGTGGACPDLGMMTAWNCDTIPSVGSSEK